MAYHFHWSRGEIMELPHKERHRWIEEISRINRRINDSAGGGGSRSSSGAGGGLKIDLKEQFLRRMREEGG